LLGARDDRLDGVRVLFEGADEDPAEPDNPDLARSTGFVSDITRLNGRRFLRWRIEFDIAASHTPLMLGMPLPQLNFLRIPFRY